MARYGLPTRLLTDNGSNFVARFMATVCRLLKVKRVFTTTYHPQTDGVVERFNGTLKAMLRKYIADDQKDWDDHVRLLLLAYNTSKHAALGETPFYLMFGREPRLAVEAMLDTDDGKGEATTVTAYRELLTRRLTQARRLAREAREAAAQKMEAGQGGSPPPSYPVGARVYLHVPAVKRGLSAKLAPRWAGPYRITEKRGPRLCRLAGVKQRLRQWIHVDRLRPFEERVPQGVPHVEDGFDPSLEEAGAFDQE
ncbi:MAG: transposase family protein [bacterium]|nr:transposase family protein [bacterium]